MAGITTPIGLLSVFWWRLVINSGAGYRLVFVFIRSIDGRFDMRPTSASVRSP
jgi:hypothetical protein